MFGGLYPDGQSEGPQLLSDLTLEKIDYDWIEAQTKASYLKRAIKLIEEDGNYFQDLKDACIKKLTKIDPSKAPKVFNNQVNDLEKHQVSQDINSWEQELRKKEEKNKNNQKIFEVQSTSNENLSEDIRKKKAENEKNKGNEALKSKDYKEAVEYYTKSIEYDPKLAASFCNRALVYLKLKEYDKVVTDCNIAIDLDKTYVKAYHRRGKARFAQDKIYEAYCDFKFIMEKDPENTEVNGDLKECQEILKKQNINPEKGLKRVQIVEEEDEENDEDSGINQEAEQIISENTVLRNKHEGEVSQIEVKKEKASQLIKDGKFDEATKLLSQCLSSIEIIGPFSQKLEDIQNFEKKKATYLNNLALCSKQIDDNGSVIKYTNQVIEMKSHLSSDILVKAYLRRAMAYERIEKYKRSLRDFKKVKHLEPGNLQSSQGMRRVQQCIQFDNEVLSASDEEWEQTTNNTTIQVEEVEEEEMVLVKKTSSADVSSSGQETKSTFVTQNEQSAPTKTATTTSTQPQKSSTLERLSSLKEEGNKLFQSKDTEGALKKFKEIALEVEVQLAQKLNAKEESVLQLYEQVLGNECLCLLNLKRYEEAVKCSTSALYYSDKNIKCLYRRAQALKALADNIEESEQEEANKSSTLENLKIQYDKYERSRKDLEKVSQLDPTNKPVKTLLQEVSKRSIEVKLALRKCESEKEQLQKQTEKADQATEKSSKVEGQEQVTPISSNNKTQTQAEINNLTEQAIQTAAENLSKAFKLPENSTQFENDFNQLKNSNERLYAYIKQVPGNHFSKVYDKNDIPSSIFLTIIRLLKEFGVKQDSVFMHQCNQFSLSFHSQEDKETSQSILRGLTQTAKFNLCVKFITKKEKLEIKELLTSLDLGSDTGLLETFKIQIEQ